MPRKDVYFIQAGSFQNPADADNQKARLAILGFESSVEPTNLPDKGTWYRVRLGPYTKVEEMNRVRQALAQNGIDASLVKIKDPAAVKATEEDSSRFALSSRARCAPARSRQARSGVDYTELKPAAAGRGAAARSRSSSSSGTAARTATTSSRCSRPG